MKKLVLIPCAFLVLAAASLSTAAPPSGRTSRLDVPPMAGDAPAALKKCSVCHGDGLGGKGKTPGIAGASKDLLAKKLSGKEGETPKQMNAVVKTLSDQDKTDLVNHISGMPKVEPPK